MQNPDQPQPIAGSETPEDEPVTIGGGDPSSELVGLGGPEERVDELEIMLEELRAELENVRASVVQPGPFPNPFLAICNSTDNTFTEAIVDNGTVSSVASPPWRSGPFIDLAADNGTTNQAMMLQFIQNKAWFVRMSGVGGVGKLTPLTTIGISTEGGDTALTDSWTRGDHAVAAWITCRVVYDDAGGQILYSFARLFTWDTNGALYSISGETRITVDVPEVCA